MAPDSCCCISIATGSSSGVPPCLSPLPLSICSRPPGQQVKASLKVGHEKTELTDMTSLCRGEVVVVVVYSKMLQRSMILLAGVTERGTHLSLSV